MSTDFFNGTKSLSSVPQRASSTAANVISSASNAAHTKIASSSPAVGTNATHSHLAFASVATPLHQIPSPIEIIPNLQEKVIKLALTLDTMSQNTTDSFKFKQLEGVMSYIQGISEAMDHTMDSINAPAANLRYSATPKFTPSK